MLPRGCGQGKDAALHAAAPGMPASGGRNVAKPAAAASTRRSDPSTGTTLEDGSCDPNGPASQFGEASPCLAGGVRLGFNREIAPMMFCHD